ncbi:MAG: TauD/TfdA family dioxygenase [Alphaproteobacteria bacterium]
MASTSLTLIPLPGDFGVQVGGLDVAEPVAPDIMAALADAFFEYRFLLLRGQHPSPDAFAAFANQWGNPRVGDAPSPLDIPGIPGMGMVGNIGDLLSRDEYRNGAAFWHTDCAAEPDADAATMLYCLQAPAAGGETVIADMQAAYDALDKATKSEIEPLMARHCYSGTRDIIGGVEDWEYPVHKMSDETIANLPPPVTRPLARPHSVTGRRALYSPAGSIIAVDGMDPAAAHTLVRRLKLHAIEDAFCYAHQHRPGDILIWDNSATMHSARPVDPPKSETDNRLHYRMVLKGLPFNLKPL